MHTNVQTYAASVPLFMRRHSAVTYTDVEPVAGEDYIYDHENQTSVWMGTTTHWTRTAYTDSKPDGYSITP